MAIDYDEFRRTTWEQRVAILSALSPEGVSDLFRSQVAGWLERHREELSPPQIAILMEAMEIAAPELYTRPPSQPLVDRMKDLDGRARDLLSREQMVDSLTMQWGMT